MLQKNALILEGVNFYNFFNWIRFIIFYYFIVFFVSKYNIVQNMTLLLQ